MTTSEPMKVDQRTIDQLVREVLSRLEGKGLSKEISNGATPNQAASPGAASGVLVLTERVVGVKNVIDRLERVAQVVVPRGAVITPAARDLLRERGISLSYSVPAPAKEKPRLAVAVAETRFDVSALLRTMRSATREIEQLASTGLVQVVRELAESITKGGQLGLLVTGSQDLALCLANRCRNVRAVAPVDRNGVREATRATAANLLVINPSGRSQFQMQQMAEDFLRSGGGECPPALRD